MLPGFLENVLESENLFCSATASTKLHWVSFSLVQLFSRHLGIHSSWEANERDAAVVGSFTPVSFL